MASLLSSALFVLYEGTAVQKIYDSLSNVMYSIQAVVNSGFLSSAFSVLSAIAAAFLLLYFWLDLMDQTMRDMFSFEKLCVSFIRLIAVFALLIVAQDLIGWIVDFGRYVFEAVSSSITINLVDESFFGMEEAELKELINETLWPGNVLTGNVREVVFIATHLLWVIYALVIDLIDIIVMLIAYVISISSALMLLVRLYWSPIAIVQAYSGVNSPGVRYIKSILADVCTLAGMVVVVYAAWQLSANFISVGATFSASAASSAEELEAAIAELFTGAHIIEALVPQFAVIGGMSGVSRVMHDVFA